MKTRLLFLFTLLSFLAAAQNEPYGESISLDQAKKVMGAAEAFAVKNQWTVVIVIVDTGGNLVLLERIDNTQIGSIDIAVAKAKTANNFKRSTKIFEDAVAKGGVGLRVLNAPGILPLEGGEPILLNGKVIGGIGVSGMQSSQDQEVLKAGLAVLK